MHGSPVFSIEASEFNCGKYVSTQKPQTTEVGSGVRTRSFRDNYSSKLYFSFTRDTMCEIALPAERSSFQSCLPLVLVFPKERRLYSNNCRGAVTVAQVSNKNGLTDTSQNSNNALHKKLWQESSWTKGWLMWLN
ncbi:Alpha-protein kinase vwkA [Fusarium oxysporum f. sp. albedinis]|nr:Alpha-protein kinase vwkA [Fusarium oxysporum f. sp. albedinis]